MTQLEFTCIFMSQIHSCHTLASLSGVWESHRITFLFLLPPKGYVFTTHAKTAYMIFTTLGGKWHVGQGDNPDPEFSTEFYTNSPIGH